MFELINNNILQINTINEDLKDTQYVQDEEQFGEELTITRANDNLQNFMKFIQLLCENHNHDLQLSLNQQISSNGQLKHN